MTLCLLSEQYLGFPPVSYADEYGLLAVGGDLSVERLIIAYSSGIFPWYEDDEPILWWSLDPRMVMRPSELKASKSLRRLVRSGKFAVSIDTDFESVIRMCSSVEREGQDGSWITEDMIKAYCELHKLGLAHSFETRFEGKLVGGLYGVSIGTLFSGESMFHTMTDASKVAFCYLCGFLEQNGFELIDAQQETEHLKSLGAYPIPRDEFISEIGGLVKKPTLLGNWGDGTARLMTVEVVEREENANQTKP